MGEAPPADMTLYPPLKYEGHAWGMSIDLNACVGCNACITACQSENNIPVVGQGAGRPRPRDALDPRRPLLRGAPRESRASTTSRSSVHAVRERALRGGLPGGRNLHSDEGLNDMVYNRCVGTRYCSNNCPYKVRRFNFFLYQDWNTPSLKLHAQPRRHGSQPRRDGEVHLLRAAHQPGADRRPGTRAAPSGTARSRPPASRPARPQAIVFGDINDPAEPGLGAEKLSRGTTASSRS